MQCPIDGATLMIAERNGVEIDYCPTCRGVWLDRGELDKIIERAAHDMAPPPPPRPSAGHGSVDHRGYRKPKKRESFLSELFDF